MKVLSTAVMVVLITALPVMGGSHGVSLDSEQPQGERIWITSASAAPGETVMLDVMLENPVTRIDAVTIRLTYDTGKLEYVDWGDGSLKPGWVMFNLNESSPGLINLGGFCVQTAIEPGSKGSIAQLSFRIKPDVDADSAFVSFEILRDDVQSFNYENGRIEIKRALKTQ
jgi:hypothetical protein